MIYNILLVGDKNEKLFNILKKYFDFENYVFNIHDFSGDKIINMKDEIRSVLNKCNNKNEKVIFVSSIGDSDKSTEWILKSKERNKTNEYILLTRYPHYPIISFGTSGRIMARLVGHTVLEVNGHYNKVHNVSTTCNKVFPVLSNHNEIINPYPFSEESGKKIIGWSNYFQSTKYSDLSKKDLPIDFLEVEILQMNKRHLFIEYELTEQEDSTIRSTFSIIYNFIEKQNK